VKTVVTITRVVERDEEVAATPKYGVGDYMEIYYGSYQNHHFWIRDVRYNHDKGCFQYLYGAGVMGGWMNEDQIVLLEKAKVAA